jgi:DNA-binding beta-propeller fold protein YncE
MVKKLLFCSIAFFGLLIVAAVPGLSVAADGSGPYEVAETVRIGGKGGFDYVTLDRRNKRLYIPRSTHTQVVDITTGKVVADIEGQKGNHGVALNRQAGRGFISDGPGFVVIFDTKTNAVLGQVKVDRGADGIINDNSTKKVYVACGASKSLVPVSVDVDPTNGKADPSIDLGGKAEYLASDGQGKIYVNLEDKDQVAVVDAKAGKVVDKWSVAPGGAPVGLSIDARKHHLFVGCRKPQELVIINTEDGHVLDHVPIGAGCDATAFDRSFEGGTILASCGEGVLNVAREKSPGKFEIVQNLKTRYRAKTMAVDGQTHMIYLPTAEYGEQTGGGRPRPKPDSFMVVVVKPVQK